MRWRRSAPRRVYRVERSMKRPSPEEQARSAGLTYVADEGDGFRRRRCGRGFTYLGPDGETLRRSGVRHRIEELAIPPAWTDVWICCDPKGHLQATGRDEEGRKQYVYHPSWVAARHRAKFRRVRGFGADLPALRCRVGKELKQRGLPRSRVLAAASRLLDWTGIRIGNPEYARRNGSYGLTTLRRKHAEVSGPRLTLDFPGKGGARIRVALDDPPLACVVSEMLAERGWRVFKYFGASGERTDLSPDDVNEYLAGAAGAYTAKDFRTWFATVGVVRELCLTRGHGDGDWQAIWLSVVDRAAEALGNTRAVARESYLPPGLEPLVVEGGLPGLLSRSARRVRAWERPGRRKGEAETLMVLDHLLDQGS